MSVDTAIQSMHDAIILTHAKIKDVDAIRYQLISVVADLLELVDDQSRKRHIDYFQEKIKPIVAELDKLENELMSKGGDIGMIYLLKNR